MDKKNCLIVIDMQVGIFHLKQPVFKKDALIQNVRSLLHAAREKRFPIIFTQHENATFLKSHSSDWEIIPAVAPRGDDMRILKGRPSIFEGTELEPTLKTFNVQHLIMCGLITNGCVQQACVEAIGKEYMVTLISDAHSTFNKRPEKIIKTWHGKLNNMGVQVIDTHTFLGVHS
jgi:nicotinamidase-related amidase